MGTLPMLPKEMKLVVIRQTSKQYQAVKTQIYRKDIKDIIIATDAGREGELVARWILDKTGCQKPIRRLWISSVTDKAIRDGFQNLKDGRAYDNLYRAAVARAEADWLVGMNGTRALTCKYNAQLSCGRVQTPTLAMIAKREEEIRSFQPKEYYGITLTAGEIQWTWREEKSKSFRTFHKEWAEAVVEQVRDKALEVTKVTTKEKNTHMGAGLQLFLLRTSADSFPKGEFLRKPPQALEVESPLLSDYDKLPAAVFPALSRKQKSIPDPGRENLYFPPGSLDILFVNGSVFYNNSAQNPDPALLPPH